jgi:hypothetical protein
MSIGMTLAKATLQPAGTLPLTPLIRFSITDIARNIELFKTSPTSSQQYFAFLLEAAFSNRSSEGDQSNHLWVEMMEGYVTSADTGSEDLVRASRAALAEVCEDNDTRRRLCTTMCEVIRCNLGNDRILVSAMEVMAFLFDVGIIQRRLSVTLDPVDVPSDIMDWSDLYLLVQRAHYKTGSVRKLEAAIKLYSGLAEVYPKVLDKLVSLLLHPFPKVRNQAADSIFAARGVCKGVNWPKAKKMDVDVLRKELQAS